MSEPFIGEIRMWSCAFAPQGWAFCDGQLLPINQYVALFSLLGTFFGGDGRATFGLPDLRGAAPMHWGAAQGGSEYVLGESAGRPSVTLLAAQTPPHTHPLQASAHIADLDKPGPQDALARSTPQTIYKQPSGAGTPQALAAGAVGVIGGGQPHNNMMPFLTLNFCIALQGVYPSRA